MGRWNVVRFNAFRQLARFCEEMDAFHENARTHLCFEANNMTYSSSYGYLKKSGKQDVPKARMGLDYGELSPTTPASGSTHRHRRMDPDASLRFMKNKEKYSRTVTSRAGHAVPTSITKVGTVQYGIDQMRDDEQMIASSSHKDRELSKLKRLLTVERSQREALQSRLRTVEVLLTEIKENQDKDEHLNAKFAAKIKKQKEQLEATERQIVAEKEKNIALERKLLQSDNEKEALREQMSLMMFKLVPSESPMFGDVGCVDNGIRESRESIGHYKMARLLGDGHYGKVHAGIDTITAEKVAIKILSKNRIARFKDLQQVMLEIHTLKNYQHPNIVHLKEVIHAKENIYIISELCSMDLHTYHSKTGLTIDNARQVAVGVLKPLAFLHSHGICHLDLKPENVLLDLKVSKQTIRHDNVRLCDFGLVNIATNPSVSKEVIRKGYACGTPGFFDPNMILKQQFEGRQADMWSFGCVILEMTFGFTQEWIDAYDIIESDPKGFCTKVQGCLEEISPASFPEHEHLIDLIHKCLSLDPSKRISSKDALHHPWIKGVHVVSGTEQKPKTTDIQEKYSARMGLFALSNFPEVCA